jgi:hypothetical protein
MNHSSGVLWFCAQRKQRRARYGSGLPELEFLLQTARALVPVFPDKANSFAANALARTVDPRLRHLIGQAVFALTCNRCTCGSQMLDRVCDYERARREKI